MPDYRDIAPPMARRDRVDAVLFERQIEVRWNNPPQNAAPIAGADYRLCPVAAGSSPCLTGTQNGNGLLEIKDFAVPGPGDWTLAVWLRDAAGNSRPETSPPPVHL